MALNRLEQPCPSTRGAGGPPRPEPSAGRSAYYLWLHGFGFGCGPGFGRGFGLGGNGRIFLNVIDTPLLMAGRIADERNHTGCTDAETVNDLSVPVIFL